MPDWQDFPPAEAEAYQRLSDALQFYIQGAVTTAGTRDALVGFRLRDIDGDLDAYLVVGAYTSRDGNPLIANIEQALTASLCFLSGPPVSTSHMREVRRR